MVTATSLAVNAVLKASKSTTTLVSEGPAYKVMFIDAGAVAAPIAVIKSVISLSTIPLPDTSRVKEAKLVLYCTCLLSFLH